MESTEAARAYENGLRILARMIARAYRQELAEKKSVAIGLKNKSMEEKIANRRNQRSHSVASAG